MTRLRVVLTFVFLHGLLVTASSQQAVVLRASSLTDDNLRFSISTTVKEVRSGQNITIYYSVQNLSSKSYYLVKPREERIRLFGENMIVEAPSGLPTNHGDFDFSFIHIKRKQKITGQVVIPKAKVQTEGVLPIAIGFGYVESIKGIDKKLSKGQDPFPLRSELENRIKRLYVGDLGVLIK